MIHRVSIPWRIVASLTFVVAAAALVTLFGPGCSALGACDRSDSENPPNVYYDGTVVDGFYMSSPWTGPWLPFAGGQRYQLFHGLGCVPRYLECWASFNGDGVGNGSMAPSAGNMCIVQAVNDEFIMVKNDTCSDMYVLVTAGGPSCGGSEVDGGDD